nr:hypothetical protein [Tanacetum cinerariifolium]
MTCTLIQRFPRIPRSNVPSSPADEAITKEMHDGLGMATTTASSLGVKQGSGNISKTKPRQHHLGQVLQELTQKMVLSATLPWGIVLFSLDKVTCLENELTIIKAVYNKAPITLTKRVKKLEKKLKHKRRREFIDSSEEEEASLDPEDSPKQGRRIEEIDKDENVNLVKSSEQGEAHETAKHRMDFNTASPQTDDDETLAESLLNIKRSAAKDKILRDEEYAQQVQDQWITEEEREILSFKERSRLLVEFIDKRKKMLAVKRAKEKRNKPPTQAQQGTYMSNYLKNMGGFVLMECKGQTADFDAGERSSKAGKNLKRSIEEELRLEQKLEKEIAQQEDVVAKQAEKESSKKAGERLKRKTSKAKEDKDKRQKKQDDPEKLTLIEYVEVISNSEEVINVIPLAVKSLIVNWKSYCNGDVGYYEIHKADGSYKTYILQ